MVFFHLYSWCGPPPPYLFILPSFSQYYYQLTVLLIIYFFLIWWHCVLPVTRAPLALWRMGAVQSTEPQDHISQVSQGWRRPFYWLYNTMNMRFTDVMTRALITYLVRYAAPLFASIPPARHTREPSKLSYLSTFQLFYLFTFQLEYLIHQIALSYTQNRRFYPLACGVYLFIFYITKKRGG